MITIILDIITKIEQKKMKPALFECVASFLEKVSHYIGREPGKSYGAYGVWERRHNEIPADMKEKLLNYARSYSANALLTLFGHSN